MLVLSNVKHIYYCLPDTTFRRGFRELKTDSDMVECMRIGYENDRQMELFTEYGGYDVLEYTANDNLVAKNFSHNEESYVSDYDGESNLENVDFYTEGARSYHMSFLIGNYNVKEDDPEVDIIYHIYKVVKGKTYPAYGLEENWKENKLVLRMRYENPQQLNHALANYGVTHENPQQLKHTLANFGILTPHSLQLTQISF
nr:hypothetical protein [Tanacetum cinerariifolium]